MIKFFIKGFIISFLSFCGMLYFSFAAISLSFPDIGFIFEQGYKPRNVRVNLLLYFFIAIGVGFLEVEIGEKKRRLQK